MSSSKRIINQWLETDAALGVSDVPIPARQRSAIKTQKAEIKNPAAKPPTPPARAAMPLAARERIGESADRRIGGGGQFSIASPARSVAPSPPAPLPTSLITGLPSLTRAQKEQALEELRKVAEEACRPHINTISTRIVFGEGDIDAPLMFVGEGPGAEEDRTGRPFVGRSGQLLDKMILAMGFQRQQVYIANVVKLRCAAPDETAGGRLKDRPPTPEEAARGLPILHRQIEIIRPKVIVTLGAPAVRHLTGNMQGVTKIRGTWLDFRGIPLMPTYHPSFLLRAYTPENRRKVWNDLQLAMDKIKGA